MRVVRYLFLMMPMLALPALARHETGICGTTHETANERLFVHRQSMRTRVQARAQTPAPSAARDIGEIAILEDSDGVVARENAFNLDQKTLKFTPALPDA